MTTVIIGLFTGKDVHPFRGQAHLNNLNQRYGFLGRKLAHKSRTSGSMVTGQTALRDRYMQEKSIIFVKYNF